MAVKSWAQMYGDSSHPEIVVYNRSAEYSIYWDGFGLHWPLRESSQNHLPALSAFKTDSR